jgi:S1-C subfamily serine protease
MSLIARWGIFLVVFFLHAEAGAVPRPDSIAPSIVKVAVVTSAPDFTAPWQRSGLRRGWGSGVVIDGNRILTNAHVVADQVDLEVRRAGDGRRFSAQVQHVCDSCDLSILTVADDEFFDGAKAIPIGELPKLEQSVRVYGFPDGGDGLAVTEGVVSRIHYGNYFHSGTSLLLAQIDAAITFGNSGGPVITDGKIVGIAMQTIGDTENIAEIVPAPVIRHFLADVADGTFDGFPELGVVAQSLENQALRQIFQITNDSPGVLVTSVSRRGSAIGLIKPGDVILAIDDLPILENNSVELESGLRVTSMYAEHRRQVGDKISVSLIRDGKKVSQKITMQGPNPLVRLGSFSRDPDYRIYGGLVFQELTQRYLRAFRSAPDHLDRFLHDPSFADYELIGAKSAREPRRRHIVVLTGLLPNGLTRGYEVFEDEIVRAVNGAPVESLGHLSSLLDNSTSQLVTLAMERGGVIVLDQTLVRRQTAQMLHRYQVAAERSPPPVVIPTESRFEAPAVPASVEGSR